MPTIRLIQESEITPALDAALVALLCLANPPEREIFAAHGRGWHGSKPIYCTIVEFNNNPIAYVGITDRTIRVAPPHGGIGVPPMFLRVAGVQNVSVHPNHRGQALSIAAITVAMNHALLQNFDAGLLFCFPHLERLYSKTGWRTLPNTSITRSENGQDLALPQQNIAMFLPLKQKSFPPGPIHLQGNDW